MRRTPGSPSPVPLTVEGLPPRASTHLRILSGLVVLLAAPTAGLFVSAATEVFVSAPAAFLVPAAFLDPAPAAFFDWVPAVFLDPAPVVFLDPAAFFLDSAMGVSLIGWGVLPPRSGAFQAVGVE